MFALHKIKNIIYEKLKENHTEVSIIYIHVKFS